jgi:5-methylcytosine-specific restriction endonuclease McrA
VRCPLCTQAYDATRPQHFRFYTSRAWRMLRTHVLLEHPVCPCGQRSTDVDHVLPRRTHPHLELVMSNMQALCASCHTRKSMMSRREAR